MHSVESLSPEAELAAVAHKVWQQLSHPAAGQGVGPGAERATAETGADIAGWRLSLGQSQTDGQGQTDSQSKDHPEPAIHHLHGWDLRLRPLSPPAFNHDLDQSLNQSLNRGSEQASDAASDPASGPTSDPGLTAGAEAQRGPRVVQYLLTQGPTLKSVTGMLRQMLLELEASRAPTLLRLTTLGSGWNSARPSEASDQGLRRLMTEGALTFADQGIFSAGAEEPDRFETLARFTGPSGQIIRAAQVLRGDESDEVLAELDRRMLSASVARLCADPALRLSVNVCRTTLLDPHWRQRFDQLHQRHPSAMTRLILEITEWPTRAVQTPLTDSSRVLDGLGVGLWLDDFGAGLTSFNEMTLSSLSGIKIDRSLLRRSFDAKGVFKVLKIVADFIRRQGKVCIVEGAETEAERAHAEAMGATHVQGYFSGAV